jgi:hypothetical protein
MPVPALALRRRLARDDEPIALRLPEAEDYNEETARPLQTEC